jgi:type IV pilus assembly protein PilE
MAQDYQLYCRVAMSNKGFSLFEICIVLIILAIITGFLYPNYQRIITQTHRVDAKLALIDLALRMDHYFTQHNSYAAATIATGKNTDIAPNILSPQGWYKLSIQHANATEFLLQATPIMDDPICHAFTLDQNGTQNILPAVPEKIRQQCW